MKPESYSRDLFKGAFILTIAALITKILSAIYRVPFQNIVGDVGFYIYQQVYPFYGVALVLAMHGFPVIISKLYAEQVIRRGQKGVQQLFLVSAITLSLIGFSGFAILYWGADWLATQMNDPELAILLRVVSVVFLIFPSVALFRGYFQGAGEMVPTAVSQVGEQLIRVVTILITAIFLTSNGSSLYIVGGGAVLGSVTGGVVAILILVTFYWIKRYHPFTLRENMDMRESGKIARALIIEGFAICVSSLLLVFMQLADSLNLYALLVASGIQSEEAKELKGVYDRGQPLIQLGTVVATSMSLSLVPIITREKLKEKQVFMQDKIRLALQIGLFVGMGATFGLWSIIKPTNRMLFENSNGSETLAVLSLLILLTSLIITSTAILQGLGIVYYPAVIILSGFGLKYFLNTFLVPSYDAMGAAVASCITLSLILLLLLIKLRVYLKTAIWNGRFVVNILVAALAMIIILKVYLLLTSIVPNMSESRLFASFQALSGVIIGGFTYLWIVIKGKTFKEEELVMLPFGSKLLLLLPKRNRR